MSEVLETALREIAQALLQADVNVMTVREIRDNIKKAIAGQSNNAGTNVRHLIQTVVLEELVRMVSPGKEPYTPKKGKINIIMFVGLQGSGKTTSCTKYAYFYKRKERLNNRDAGVFTECRSLDFKKRNVLTLGSNSIRWKTALVCADTFRAGAFDQLKQNATKAKIPFYGSYTEADPVAIAMEGVEQFKAEKYDLIIVDTSGRHKQEEALFEEMKQVSAAVNPDNVVFVMDSHIGQACFEQAQAFRNAVNVGSVIVTKLDGNAKGGGAISAVAATHSPIIFLGTGERFDDFEAFKAQSFISRLLGRGDVSELFNAINENVPKELQNQMVDRISKGKISLRDMYQQYQNVLRLGSPATLISMFPLMGNNVLSSGQGEAGMAKLQRFMTILDSLTPEELDNEKSLDQSRINRIVIGSGTSVEEIQGLLEQHKQFQKMVGGLGKMGLSNEASMQHMMRNPQQMMSRMQHMFDPKVMKQIGGAGNLMNLMKELNHMDGASGIQNMMQQMSMGTSGRRK
ncbi:signal recognition particle SRP54 protein [Cardiosporidium cionae]|uniref:signal-recognition-particle GTPase n=1 Tax=Cardiosporidium cionae TaxID=476202 RepID=A0ABQ7J6L9_9APIC|nr:signal recognition particle SRP54 protein [Cardiosporidium cionae]|eukprot:KAF8819635.1 signal recognition particle SRP54 protein [Cardiosporidium cionae]